MRSGLLLLLLVAACSTDAAKAQAYRISRNEDLIGGPAALGEVGDFMLQNGHIRVIVQDVGFSRGFGVYGGSIIDADIRRSDQGDAQGGRGNDRFAEMFPIFFLQAANPSKIEVKNDGSNGKPARVIVHADAGPFLSLVTTFNEAALGKSDYEYEVEYSLGPNDRFVKMTTSLTNRSGSSRQLQIALGGLRIRVPFGTVALFGSQNKVFVPGPAGFDLRWILPDEIKANPVQLPALPGLVADLIATKGDGVSYGVFAEPNADSNFAFQNNNQYKGKANEGSLEIPFFFSSFIGYFYAVGPNTIANSDTFSFTQYFAIGHGDVADVRDVFHEVRKVPTGKFGGRVRDAQTLKGTQNVSVVVYDANGQPFNQHTTNEKGDFVGTYPPGDYSYELVTDRTNIPPRVAFSVSEGKTTSIDVTLQGGAFLNVQIVDELGRHVPAKVTLLGTHDYPGSPDVDPRLFLFNLARGERRRPTDQTPDVEDDPSTRQFIELQSWTPNGQVGAEVRPGRYTVLVSRGPEYEVEKKEVELKAGEGASVQVTLHHVVDTPGYVSGDLHLHSANSIDSALAVSDRVTGVAGEGLDFAVATDHNYITDYAPYVQNLGLEQFLLPIVGLEMTTLELGHFNGYPLKYDLAESTHGSFSWFGRNAQDIFDDIRKRGKYGREDTIVQVNHPRDNLLGYFSQLGIDAEDMDGVKPPEQRGTFTSSGDPFKRENWSFDFDALEIYNGKRWDLLKTMRAPEPTPAPPFLVTDVLPGDILRYPTGEIAYPGAVEDWFHLLNLGYRFVGVANSDSHGNTYEEPGYPRTYVRVDKDDPYEVRDLEIVRALKAKKATLTNGPFVEMFVNEQPIGSELSGVHEIDVRVRIARPSWVEVDTLVFYINGEAVRQHQLHADVREDLVTDHFTLTRDAWIVAEVSSKNGKSLWPVVTGWEEPPLTVADAIAGLAGPLGITFQSVGNIHLPRPVFPYAITNPVWIDYDADGEWATLKNPEKATREVIPAPAKPPRPDDVRALFKLFGGHH